MVLLISRSKTDVILYNPSSNIWVHLVEVVQTLQVYANQLSSGTMLMLVSTTLPAASGANLTILMVQTSHQELLQMQEFQHLPHQNFQVHYPLLWCKLTNLPEPDEVQLSFTVTANGSSAYDLVVVVLTPPKMTTLYLIRGQKYRFNNTTGSTIHFSFVGQLEVHITLVFQVIKMVFNISYQTKCSFKIILYLHTSSNMVGTIYIQGSND